MEIQVHFQEFFAKFSRIPGIPGSAVYTVPYRKSCHQKDTTTMGFSFKIKPFVSFSAEDAASSDEKATNACPFILPSFIRRISNLEDKETNMQYLVKV